MESSERFPWIFHNKLSKTNLSIVLDYDETLVHSYNNMNDWDTLKILEDPKKIDLRERTYVLNIETDRVTGHEERMWGITRPHLDDFIKFCFMYFRVVIPWSAGVFGYVHQVTEPIFKNNQEPHAILTRSNCVGSTHKLEKPFWKMMKDVPGLDKYIELDGTSGPDNVKNVFILDDRRSAFSQNPNNGICIPVYEPNPTAEGLRKDDICLLQVMNWLLRPEVMNCKDVRQLDKSKIFTTALPTTVPTTVQSKVPQVDISTRGVIGKKSVGLST